MTDPNLLPFFDRVLGLLIVLLAVLAVLLVAGWLAERWQARDRRIHRAPDDPRLRNEALLRDWRAKRSAPKHRWIT